MKIGNIRDIVSKIASDFLEKISPHGITVSENFEWRIKELPKVCLDEFFQKRFNKNLDYDQWAGIREELERMGRDLYQKSLTIIGDTIFLIQGENESKIQELKMQLRDEQDAHQKTKGELKKYID